MAYTRLHWASSTATEPALTFSENGKLGLNLQLGAVVILQIFITPSSKVYTWPLLQMTTV